VKVCLLFVALFAMLFALPETVHAQITHHLNFSAGAGFTKPVGDAGDHLDTGWNFNLRGGFNASRRLALDLDFSYNRADLNSATLAAFGEPGGYATLWSLSFQPMYRFTPDGPVDFYTTAGVGVYHRDISLTQPTNVSTIFCDPFYGVCYPVVVPADQVVASFDTYKGGFDVGAGLEFGHWSSMKFFSEARYQRMFTTHGSDFTEVPVTFGVRW
jgi:opacity protein-like surface antigen